MKKTLLLLLAAAFIVMASSASIFAEAKKDSGSSTLTSRGQTGIYNGVGNIKQIARINISRGEFIAQLHKLLDIKIYYFVAPDVHSVFSDVSNDYKYADQLYDMYSTGIVDDKGTFRPNDILTRQEAVHYIVRAYNYKTNDAQVGQETGTISVKNSNVGYLNDITQARKFGLVGKDRIPTFKKPITRTELASLVTKLENLINQKVKFLGPPVKKPADLGVTSSAKTDNQGLEMSVNITNNSDKTISTYYQPGRVCDYILLDENNNEIYRWSKGKMFTMIMLQLELKPGESKQFKEYLSITDYKDVIDKAKYLKVEVNLNVDGVTVETPNVVEIAK